MPPSARIFLFVTSDKFLNLFNLRADLAFVSNNGEINII